MMDAGRHCPLEYERVKHSPHPLPRLPQQDSRGRVATELPVPRLAPQHATNHVNRLNRMPGEGQDCRGPNTDDPLRSERSPHSRKPGFGCKVIILGPILLVYQSKVILSTVFELARDRIPTAKGMGEPRPMELGRPPGKGKSPASASRADRPPAGKWMAVVTNFPAGLPGSRSRWAVANRWR